MTAFSYAYVTGLQQSLGAVIADFVERNRQLNKQVTSLMETSTKQINEIRQLRRKLNEAKRSR